MTTPDQQAPPGADIIVVGAGPTGLTLACELALTGVNTVVIERNHTPRAETRATVLHARTLEYLAMRGVVDRFLARGHVCDNYPIGHDPARVRMRHLDSPYPHILVLAQPVTEHILRTRAAELGVQFSPDTTLTALHQHANHVTATVLRGGDEHTVSAAYLVGCDGVRSTVRQLTEIPATSRSLPGHITIADTRLARITPGQMTSRFTPRGLVFIIPFGGTRFRVILYDYNPQPGQAEGPVDEHEFRSRLRHITGTDLGLHDTEWASRYTSTEQLARNYRSGRVFLAGDAAHVHSPAGGQGLNLGVGDAMNLGWKLGAVLHGHAPDSLLDTYQHERQPAAAAVLANTRHLLRFNTATHPAARAARWLALRTLAHTPPVQRWLAHQLAGTHVRYPMSPRRSPNTSRRVPDMPVTDPDGQPSTLYTQHRKGTFILLTPHATTVPASQTPLINAIAPQLERALLIRPDGHLAGTCPPENAADMVAAWSPSGKHEHA